MGLKLRGNEATQNKAQTRSKSVPWQGSGVRCVHGPASDQRSSRMLKLRSVASTRTHSVLRTKAPRLYVISEFSKLLPRLPSGITGRMDGYFLLALLCVCFMRAAYYPSVIEHPNDTFLPRERLASSRSISSGLSQLGCTGPVTLPRASSLFNMPKPISTRWQAHPFNCCTCVILWHHIASILVSAVGKKNRSDRRSGRGGEKADRGSEQTETKTPISSAVSPEGWS